MNRRRFLSMLGKLPALAVVPLPLSAFLAPSRKVWVLKCGPFSRRPDGPKTIEEAWGRLEMYHDDLASKVDQQELDALAERLVSCTHGPDVKIHCNRLINNAGIFVSGDKWG